MFCRAFNELSNDTHLNDIGLMRNELFLAQATAFILSVWSIWVSVELWLWWFCSGAAAWRKVICSQLSRQWKRIICEDDRYYSARMARTEPFERCNLLNAAHPRSTDPFLIQLIAIIWFNKVPPGGLDGTFNWNSVSSGMHLHLVEPSKVRTRWLVKIEGASTSREPCVCLNAAPKCQQTDVNETPTAASALCQHFAPPFPLSFANVNTNKFHAVAGTAARWPQSSSSSELYLFEEIFLVGELEFHFKHFKFDAMWTRFGDVVPESAARWRWGPRNAWIFLKIRHWRWYLTDLPFIYSRDEPSPFNEAVTQPTVLSAR
jgi:hypothetical protein